MITVNRQAFAKACQSANATASRDPNGPITFLSFLSYSDGLLSVRATDTSNYLTHGIPSDGDGLQDIFLDAAKLSDTVSKMSGDELKLSTDAGALHITGGRGSKRKLSGSVMTYPSPPSPTGAAHALDIAAFRDAIAIAGPSMAGDDKPDYHGVRVQAGSAVTYNGNGFVAAAIDGLAVDVGVTLSASTVKLLKCLPSDGVSLYVTDRMLAFQWETGSIVSKRMDNEWRFLANGIDALLPVHEHTLSVHPSDLLAAISAVRPVSADDQVSRSKVVVLSLSRERCSMTPSSQAGSAYEEFDAEWSGDPLVVRLLGDSLSSALAGFAGDMPAEIGITALPDRDGAEKPKGCVIRQPSRAGVVAMLSQVRG